jgi:hypothetical protein
LADDFAVLQGVQASLELEDRFRTGKDYLAHANVLASKYQDTKKASVEAKKLADEADAKRKEAKKSLDAALASLTKAEDKIRALELEFERAKKAAYESGSKDAQEEMRLQLPGVCNEFYTEAWNDAIAVLNFGQSTLPPKPLKLPFPSATPPPPPELVLNSPPPQLGVITVDLEEVNSAEAEGPADVGHLPDAPALAPEGGSTQL